MSPNNTPILYVGLDVAKLTLELHLGAKTYALTHDPKGHAQLCKHLRAQPGAHVVCEATGGYEQPVVRALHTDTDERPTTPGRSLPAAATTHSGAQR